VEKFQNELGDSY